MSENSSIEWTDATWNPVRGCTKISPGCKLLLDGRTYDEMPPRNVRPIPTRSQRMVVLDELAGTRAT